MALTGADCPACGSEMDYAISTDEQGQSRGACGLCGAKWRVVPSGDPGKRDTIIIELATMEPPPPEVVG